MNQLYTPAREKFLTGQLDWRVLDVRLILVSATYIFSTNHEFLDSIPLAARVADGDVLNETTTDGFAQGDQVLFPGLLGDEITQIILYANTGAESTSPLIAYYDTVTGVPFTPTGIDYYISPDLVFGGFFRL